MLVHADGQQPNRRVLVHGLDYFGPLLAKFMTGDGWEFQYYPDKGLENLAAMIDALRRCDLVYQIGGRVTIGKFLCAAKLFGKKRIVMHWVGSDTLDHKQVAAAGKVHPWVRNTIHHWGNSEWLSKEVASLGISCEFVLQTSPKVPDHPSPLPRDFSVLVYVPSVERSELYGLGVILDVARQLPEIRFELVGLRDGPVRNPPPNIFIHRRVPDLTAFYERASVLWRPTRHDGQSWMVLEALGHGRHVLWTYPLPGCVQVTSASEARDHILRLYHLHHEKNLAINEEGARFITSSEYNPAKFKSQFRSRLQKILES